MMKQKRSSRLHSDCRQFARFQSATPGTGHDAEAILQSALEHPFWAQRCAVGWPNLWGRGPGVHWGCDETECGTTLLLLPHPKGPRRYKLPPCLCSCSLHSWRAQGEDPMSGGVVGKREWRGPTHTLIMLSRPPAPKNIAFNQQGGKDFTGPWWTSLDQDGSSPSSSLAGFSLKEEIKYY